MGKRIKGQLHLSFSMIVSIIVIIATVSIGGYVIWRIVDFNNCVSVSTFYSNLDDSVRSAYSSSGGYYDSISFDVSKGVEKVCIGNANSSRGEYSQEYDNLRRFLSRGNVFIYPREAVCEGGLPYYKIEEISNTEFFCIDNVDGKVNIKITKEIFGPVVLGK